MERGGERGRDRQREVERERWRERGGERERWRDRETERETRMNAANQNPNKPKTVSRVRFLLSAVAENQQWHHRIITISTKLGPSLLLFDVILVRSSKPAHWLLHTHTHTRLAPACTKIHRQTDTCKALPKTTWQEAGWPGTTTTTTTTTTTKAKHKSSTSSSGMAWHGEQAENKRVASAPHQS